MYYIIWDIQHFDSSVSFMHFLDVTFFHVLHSSYGTWLIENIKYLLTDRITRLIKFWILIIITSHIYIALCHTQSIYTYILILLTTLWVKWGRYYILHFTKEETKVEEMKWFVQGHITSVGWVMIPQTIPCPVLYSLSQSNLLRDHSHLVICFFQQSLIEDRRRESSLPISINLFPHL